MHFTDDVKMHPMSATAFFEACIGIACPQNYAIPKMRPVGKIHSNDDKDGD